MRRRTSVAASLLALGAACALAAEPPTAGFHPAPPAAAPVHRAARAPVPAANFLVEWRLQPPDAGPAPRGDVVITSGSAVTGTSGYGAHAVVAGTARPAAPQAVRVANGREGAIVFDRSQTHTVHDMAWRAEASASATTDGSAQVVMGAASSVTTIGGGRSVAQSHEAGVQGHEVVVHRVDGLRVTPRWSHGETLELELALTRVAPAPVSRNAAAARAPAATSISTRPSRPASTSG